MFSVTRTMEGVEELKKIKADDGDADCLTNTLNILNTINILSLPLRLSKLPLPPSGFSGSVSSSLSLPPSLPRSRIIQLNFHDEGITRPISHPSRRSRILQRWKNLLIERQKRKCSKNFSLLLFPLPFFFRLKVKETRQRMNRRKRWRR